MAGRVFAARHPIEIQENKGTETGIRPDDDWVAVLRTFAAITPISAIEKQTRQSVVGEVTHLIRTRYWEPLTIEHRIKYGTRVFGIVSIINEEELNRYFTIEAKEAA